MHNGRTSRAVLSRDLKKIRESWSPQTRHGRAKIALQRQQKLWQLLGPSLAGSERGRWRTAG